MDPVTTPAIAAILREMAALTTMEHGTLTAEYRTRPARGGRCVQLGPYYKFQVWEGGRNASRRVPAAEIAALQADLANHRRFTGLAGAFVEEAVARSRALRLRPGPPNESAAAKKSSAKKRGAKDVRKRKLSPPKSKRA